MMIHRLSVVGLSAALALFSAGSAYSASKIGVTAAVTNQVSGTVGGSAKRLKSGDSVFQNQVIQTRARSNAQFLFADETAFTVGPQSRVVLDKYVYDPGKRAGKIVFNATKGAFRFVTGNARKNSYRIRTPFGVVGVRGTIFDMFMNSQYLILVLSEGAVIFRANSGRTATVNRPGNYIIVKRDGSILGPAPWSGSFWSIVRGVPNPLIGRNTLNNFSELPDLFDSPDFGGGGGTPGGQTGDGNGYIIK